jgi:hypothetical protein
MLTETKITGIEQFWGESMPGAMRLLISEVRRLHGELARFQTPQPISVLHEDDGEVIAARWSGMDLDEWECTSRMATGFDESNWTHFYPLPSIQPPTPRDALEVQS